MANPEPAGHTEVHGGAPHEGGAFPPFDAANFSPILIWLALSFGVLYLLMSRIALPRMAGILESRSAKIETDLNEAAVMQKKASDAAIIHEKNIQDAKAQAQGLAQAARDRLSAENDAKRHELEAGLTTKMVAAEEQIASMKNAAMGNVGAIAEEAALSIVQHLLGKAPSASSVSAAKAQVTTA